MLIKSMKHVECMQTGRVDVTDIETPFAGTGELLVRMVACGICGTDVMKVYDPSVAKPVQLGHEIVGTIIETGQRVAVAHHAPDLISHYTKRGSATQDPQFKASNIFPGGFAEFIRVPSDLVPYTVIAIPDHVPDMRAVFMEPLACCLRALVRVPVQQGDTVAIIGVGSIGMLFVPLMKHQGAAVIAVDMREDRLALARQWGADATSLASSEDLPAEAKRLSHNRGADLVILTTTNPATLRLALDALRDGGTIIPFGVKPGAEMPFDFWQIYRREISVISSYSATPQDLTRAMQLLSGKGFELESLISHTFSLAEAGQGFELLHDAKASKVVVHGR
jgi:L-iditol 2-dehydrogenase